MEMDPRARAARYYDLNPRFPSDVPFYLDRLPKGGATVLELGCGTGRVSVPLALGSTFLHGVDHSPAMAEICRGKLLASGLRPERACVSFADITDLRLDTRFDFVVAPFRVMQNLVSDAQVVGLFAVVRAHLNVGGRCILNAFRPNRVPEVLLTDWCSSDETLEWDVPFENGRVVHSNRRTRILAEPLVLCPDLIYRQYRGDRLEDETVLAIAMRCWYPDELLSRIRAEGFEVTGAWGGYGGEAYGEGPELVVEFTLSGRGDR
jgi:SAM-dependent methyltransferase